MIKILQVRLHNTWTMNFQMFKLILEKAKEPEIKLPTSTGSLKKWATAATMSLQSCPTLCHPIDGSPQGSPVPGILQARTLEWVAISFPNAWKWKVKVKLLSYVWLSANSWTWAYKALLSMGFSRQEYWSGVPLPSLPCVCVYIYPNVLFLWRILIESYTSPFESLEESISRVPWPSVGLRSAESGLCKKRHVKFTKVVGHMFLWVLS